MDLTVHKKTGLWYPKDSGSQCAIKEAYFLEDYGGLPSMAPFNGAVVMDCGAHIGAFAKRALMEGASEVICYEPFPASIECLKKNVPEARIVRSAIVEDGAEKTLDFHYRPERLEAGSLQHKGANHKRWNYQTMTVPTVEFWSEVESRKPTIIKMDIEGTEWKIFKERTIPNFVKALFIEVHQLYSLGAEAGLDFIADLFPGGVEVDHVELIPFKNKGKVTAVSGLFLRK